MTLGAGTGASGTIFKINIDGTGYQVLHSFGTVPNDGYSPYGSLTLSGSTLYGMTEAGGANGKGTIFQINADGTGYQVLYSFGSVASDGCYPYGSLTLSGTTLYGMTSRWRCRRQLRHDFPGKHGRHRVPGAVQLRQCCKRRG